MNPIDKILDEDNCVRVTERGKEICECVVKLTNAGTLAHARPALSGQPHSHQSCEVTYRNPIQGRFEQASEPTITKPFSFVRIGKLGASAATVNRLILGELKSKSGSRLYAQSRSTTGKTIVRHQQSAEVIVRIHHKPMMTGRTEP